MTAGTTPIARLVVLFSMASMVACIGGIGSDDGGGIPGDPDRIPSDDPSVDDRLDALEIVCETTLVVTGTYQATEPQPDDMTGCWEVGIWSVNWDIDFEGCDPQPGFADTFTYEARRDDEDNADSTITWTDNPDYDDLNLKISTNGDSLCHGSFEHYGLDGNDRVLLTLQPTLQADGTLAGIGAWSLYKDGNF